MKLSAEAKYALRAMFDIAYHEDGRPTKAESIARREGIPEKFLEQILRKLKGAGLLDSKRGPKGGYSMLQAPEDVTVGAIIRAVEGPCEHDCCYDTDAETLERCSLSSRCVTASTWRDIAKKIDLLLESETVADMCTRAQRFGIAREGGTGFMYMI